MTIFPEYYPVDYTPVRIELKNSQFYDDDEIYWQVEPKQLERACQQKVMERIHQGEVEHVSLFANSSDFLISPRGPSEESAIICAQFERSHLSIVTPSISSDLLQPSNSHLP